MFLIKQRVYTYYLALLSSCKNGAFLLKLYRLMKQENVLITLEKLNAMYPDAQTELNYSTPYELLVAVILSAQCTDKRVNIVTKELFKKYNTPSQIAKLPQSELEAIIYSCGFYRAKAKHIISASKSIMENFGGEVPQKYEELLSLEGVGRKTANVISAVAFGKNAIAVDTHVFRVSNRIGLAKADNVLNTEKQLMQNIPQELWSKAHHLLIFHGRNICKAKPICKQCGIKEYCGYYKIIK